MLMAQQQLMAIRTAQARMALVQQEVRSIVGLEEIIENYCNCIRLVPQINDNK